MTNTDLLKGIGSIVIGCLSIIHYIFYPTKTSPDIYNSNFGRIAFGGLLIILGILILTGYFNR